MSFSGRTQSRLRLVLLPLLFSTLVHAASNSTCYFPDGVTQAPGDTPCRDPATGYSSCCINGAVCLAGGLCLQDFLVVRASCTDPTWQDPSCARLCKNTVMNAAAIISPAQVNPNRWCCGVTSGNKTCVDTDNNPAPTGIDFAMPQTVIGYSNSSYGNLMPWAHTTNSGAGTVNGTAGANGTCPSPTAKKDDTTAVGAGVGVALGVPLLAALAALGLSINKTRKLQRQLSNQGGVWPTSANGEKGGHNGSVWPYVSNGSTEPGHQRRAEMPEAKERRAELPNGDEVAEIGGKPLPAAPVGSGRRSWRGAWS